MATKTKVKKSLRVKNTYETPTEAKRAVGKRMAEARDVAALSMTDAATALGYAQPVQLSQFEAGKRFPPIEVIVRCARLYGTTTDFLLGLCDDADRDPAVAVSRHVEASVTGEMRRLISAMTDYSVEIVRRVMPTAAESQRLAGLTLEASAALSELRRAAPDFDDLRGGARLVAKLEAASAAAAAYADKVARTQRLLRHRAVADTEKTTQISLLPTLEIQG